MLLMNILLVLSNEPVFQNIKDISEFDVESEDHWQKIFFDNSNSYT